MWNPWRGCHKCSEGCKFCYIHQGDARRGIDTGNIVRTDNFTAPLARKKNGEYRIGSGQIVYLCFSTDFLLPEADPWRQECWEMMTQRSDLHFLFLTKRIERFARCLPDNWGAGYDNVTVGCTIENQQRADERLPLLAELPIKHRNIICQPLLGAMNIEQYLADIELVVVGGEANRQARPLDYQWVLALRAQCLRQQVPFQFRQCGTYFIKDGREYRLSGRDLARQAKKAGIDC